MKDLIKVLENSRKTTHQKVYNLSGRQVNMSEWKALNIIEEASMEMQGRLLAVMPSSHRHSVMNVKVDMYEKPGRGKKLLVKAQVFPWEKQDILLKVFVHELDERGRAIKLARAHYQISIRDKRKVA